MYKLKTMFIPLAPTTSTSSSSSPLPSTTPLDDGITTGQALHLRPHPKAQDQCNHQEVLLQLAGEHQMATPTVSTPAPVLTDAVQKCVDTAAESISYTQGSQVSLYAGNSEEDLKGHIQRTYNSSFSWDITSTECLCWEFLHLVEDHLHIL